MFLLLILSSVNYSSVKLVSAATGDLVNYNNNFDIYTSPSDPNKDSAMQNADCVVNFMQTYVYASSSADSCTNTAAPTPATPSDQAQTPIQSQGYPSTVSSIPAQQATAAPPAAPIATAAPEGPQTGVADQGESVGVVRVVDNNTNGGTLAPIQSSSSSTNAQDDDDKDDKDARDKDDDDDKDDKDARDKDDDDDKDDKDARDKDDDDARDKDDDDDRDNDSETKIYNENTVTKQERKLLLTTCFERAYDKGDYLSTKEIVKCAENYNS